MKTYLIVALALLCPFAAHAAQPDLIFQAGDRVRAVAKTVKGIPSDWRFIVVNDVQWQTIIAKNGLGDNLPQSAVSNLRDHFTFIREGYAIQAPESELRKSLAHELGHYMCGCTDEDKANHFQDIILRGEIQ